MESVDNQETRFQLKKNIVLVDDGSTDGTSSAVQDQFPEVTVIRGDGNLYWNGGMRVAMNHAMELEPDFYLLLNDDTTLYSDAISRLIKEHHGLRERREVPIALVGSTQDPQSGEITYGGWKTNKWWNPLHTEIVRPSDRPIKCDTFNANCALIEKEVVATVGNLDPSYTHGFGDFDYGFRVNASGGEVWVGSGFHGECIRDHGEHPWFDTNRSWKERIDALREVKAEPLDERMVYARRHGGPLWVVPWLSPYLRVTLDYLFPGAFRPSTPFDDDTVSSQERS
ncbi:GT2 family glycosyltransferase [Salinibacter ruber]|nr:GT2 family glycosyltransferase [Salinibacter ruber]